MKTQSTKEQLLSATIATAPAARQRALDNNWTDAQIARHLTHLNVQVAAGVVVGAKALKAPKQVTPLLGTMPVTLTRDGVVIAGTLTLQEARPLANGQVGTTHDRTITAQGISAKGTMSPKVLDQVIANGTTTVWLNDVSYKLARA